MTIYIFSLIVVARNVIFDTIQRDWNNDEKAKYVVIWKIKPD